MKPIIKSLLKILTSGELIELLDKNKNGKVEWSEIKSAPATVWIEIATKFWPVVLLFL